MDREPSDKCAVHLANAWRLRTNLQEASAHAQPHPKASKYLARGTGQYLDRDSPVSTSGFVPARRR